MNERTEQMLAVNIGRGNPTLGYELLKSASRDGGSQIPRNWSSNKLYAALAEKGLVAESEAKNMFLRRWVITEAGRKAISN